MHDSFIQSKNFHSLTKDTRPWCDKPKNSFISKHQTGGRSSYRKSIDGKLFSYISLAGCKETMVVFHCRLQEYKLLLAHLWAKKPGAINVWWCFSKG